ncbi:hypothetical protein EDB81DRAFT_467464 [Dactylonectria macrodidyma]|uniref:Uncharacterized protein n=1 Tax=Dactylonectria macrodidyma TaxID=307937 RepID=A0A9P9J9W9_9HYPO|nr:hypothetical protein EDB81DRAFT_467464 [Dactylonectria macrodidyma]
MPRNLSLSPFIYLVYLPSHTVCGQSKKYIRVRSSVAVPLSDLALPIPGRHNSVPTSHNPYPAPRPTAVPFALRGHLRRRQPVHVSCRIHSLSLEHRILESTLPQKQARFAPRPEAALALACQLARYLPKAPTWPRAPSLQRPSPSNLASTIPGRIGRTGRTGQTGLTKRPQYVSPSSPTTPTVVPWKSPEIPWTSPVGSCVSRLACVPARLLVSWPWRRKWLLIALNLGVAPSASFNLPLGIPSSSLFPTTRSGCLHSPILSLPFFIFHLHFLTHHVHHRRLDGHPARPASYR